MRVVGVVVLVNLLKIMVHIIVAVGGVIGYENPAWKWRENNEKYNIR